MDEYENFIDYQAIRARVERRLARRIAFFTHLLIFTFVSMTFIYNPFWKGTPLVEVGSVVWFILLMIHGGYWLFGETRDRAIRKEIERERKAAQMMAAYGKAKRNSFDHLRDDGALIDFDAAEWDTEAKYKRG
ncbi:MAG: hypothetical protein KC547_19615 [Anaerolineae bacterium]|nr:hypothetical protein [Anaerolineae bacterium]